MDHAGEGLLQAYIDGEADDAAEAALLAHVESCRECGRELEELRVASATFHNAISLLGASPRAAVTAAVIRAAAADTQVTPIESRREARVATGHRFSRFAAGSLARAAALVLIVAGAAAAMIPGSPLRRWIGQGIERLSGGSSSNSVATPAPSVPATAVIPRREMVPGAEMSIAPVNGHVRVTVSATAGAGRLVIRLVDSERATVQTDSSAHGVAFRSAPGRIEIVNLGSADATVQIPRSLRSATVEVNGRELFTKDGDSVHVKGTVVRRSETEIVLQTGS